MEHMVSDNQQTTTSTAMQPADYPTSPWTELYQAAMETTQPAAMPAAQPDFGDDTQQPTRDALSVSYN